MMNDIDYVGEPWIGVDLDGTLAYYDGWKGFNHIGEPIMNMLNMVHCWLSKGMDVRIFTARVSQPNEEDNFIARHYIEDWCLKHMRRVLPITNIKDRAMIELWDDRCVQVIKNMGIPVVQGPCPGWFGKEK